MVDSNIVRYFLGDSTNNSELLKSDVNKFDALIMQMNWKFLYAEKRK